MYYSYVLQSEKDNGFYIGFTKDLKLRFDHKIVNKILFNRVNPACPVKCLPCAVLHLLHRGEAYFTWGLTPMSNNYSILLTIDVEDWFQVENFTPWNSGNFTY